MTEISSGSGKLRDSWGTNQILINRHISKIGSENVQMKTQAGYVNLPIYGGSYLMNTSEQECECFYT